MVPKIQRTFSFKSYARLPSKTTLSHDIMSIFLCLRNKTPAKSKNHVVHFNVMRYTKKEDWFLYYRFQYLQSFKSITEKMPKEGVYADTKQNRALNRVGKPYGTAVLNR